jgi:hypothetical protein
VTTQPEMQRPFGLVLMTALNLGIGLMNVGAAVQCGLALKMRLDPSTQVGFDVAVATGLMALPTWFLGYVIAVSALKAGLLFASGIGYFNFKRVLGRYLGNTYAVVSLADSAVVALALPYPITGASIIAMLYALFTLLALNTMFKPILVR